MRIRKRFPPSSAASISSAAALSDPLFNRSPVVQQLTQVIISPPAENPHVVQEDAKNSNPRNPDPPNLPLEQPKAQVITTTSQNPRWDFLNSGNNIIHQEKLKHKEIEGNKEIKDERCSCNDARKDGINNKQEEELSATQFPLPHTSSSPVSERWCEGDKVVPLKKRRGSFETTSSSVTTIASAEEWTTKAKMKSKTNKKCLIQDGVDQGLQEGMIDNNAASGGSAKKSKRGNVIMEGSRCSRVNGRGWRCCQPTLVGYSLCEHHLGKGRLRSMTCNVRNRGIMTCQIGASDQNKTDDITRTTAEPMISSSSSRGEAEGVNKSLSPSKNNTSIDDVDDHDELDDDDCEKKALQVVVTKKRMKLGAVKARSMSSLLGQTNN